MKTDLFQSCGHCWVFQICWHIECSTFTASSFSIWNSSTGIPSPPQALFVVMLSKAHLTSHSRMSGYTWTSPDGQHRNQIVYILWGQRWRSSIQSAKTRPGADCGLDHELTAKFRLKLKKVGKTTRSFRYDLKQIPYDYTVEVRNRFKGLDLIDRVPDELWNEVRDIVQETGLKTIPIEKKCKKAKWLPG